MKINSKKLRACIEAKIQMRGLSRAEVERARKRAALEERKAEIMEGRKAGLTKEDIYAAIRETAKKAGIGCRVISATLKEWEGESAAPRRRNAVKKAKAKSDNPLPLKTRPPRLR